MTTLWHTQVTRAADGIRRRVLAHTLANGGGYMSQACSAAEILATMYLRVMHLGMPDAPLTPPPFPGVPGPHNPGYATGAAFNGQVGPDLDRFILSPSQYSLVLYAALVELGRMSADGLEHFNRDGSSVEMIGAEHSPGMELMSGSLGQGLSQAVGIALARKRRGDTGRVWVFMSDGELQIGMVWEALQVMAHYQLDNMGLYVDVNGQQCDGTVESVMTIEPLVERLTAFGCRVERVDAHDPAALAAPAEAPRDGRPLVVLCDSDPCRCVPPLTARAPRLHYLRFTSDEERDAYAALLDAWGGPP